MDVQKGLIKNIKIFGDFFASNPIEELEQLLIDVKHEENEIHQVLSQVDIKNYFGKVSLEEIIDIFK